MMLLRVSNLTVRLKLPGGSFTAVDKVSFSVPQGETMALVGESGCGKTLTALALLRLVPSVARSDAESIALSGRELTQLSDKEMQAVRGRDLAMIFQEPLTALNPVFTIGEQIAESLRLHKHLGRRRAWEQAVTTLREVGMPDPKQRAREYPHELSGGMRQRAMIATAIACEPSLLIADEPTTALDVSVQAQIIDLLLRLQAERRMSMLLITHDLGIVAEMTHQVAVMYAGQIVEQAAVRELFASPLHPYTSGLLASVPKLFRVPAEHPASGRLPCIEGVVPDVAKLPTGCRFAPRCVRAVEQCREPQELWVVNANHMARCCRAKELTREREGDRVTG